MTEGTKYKKRVIQANSSDEASDDDIPLVSSLTSRARWAVLEALDEGPGKWLSEHV